MYTQYAEATRVYIKAILLLLGADNNDALDTAINGIFELERRLAKVVDCDNVYTIYFAEQLNVLNTICHAVYLYIEKSHGIP